MPAIKLSKLQREYFAALGREKDRIERDITIAASVVLAGAGIDTTPDMTFNFDGKCLTYSETQAGEP